LTVDAAAGGARIVCFPEAYLPGLRGQDFDVWPYDAAVQEQAFSGVGRIARAHGIAIVMGIELVQSRGRLIGAAVFDRQGELIGVQTKNQLDPTEEPNYVPGDERRVFEIDGLRFGVAICHEGFRYPETVRWAAARGAHLVFHPHLTGSDSTGRVPARWCDPDAPYYERAVMMRSLENTIYMASVNYAARHQESATCVVSPAGECVAALPYGEEGVLVCGIDPALATGELARRYAPGRYRSI